MFTLGPGFLVAGAVSRGLDAMTRVIVLLAVGTAAAPALIDFLGRAALIPAFPYLASAAGGAFVAATIGDVVVAPAIGGTWPVGHVGNAGCRAAANRSRRRRGLRRAGRPLDRARHRRVLAPASIGGDGIRLFGDYDSADMSWYAAVASEASHTVPPTASYYSGHQLNAAYYAHLVAAMIHRFCGVPILSMFFRYALADLRVAAAR